MMYNEDNFLLDLVRNSPLGICIMDSTSLVVEIANEPYLEVACRTQEQTIGHHFWDIFPELKKGFEKELQKAINGETVRYEEIKMPFVRFGVLETIVIAFDYRPIRNNTGQVVKVVVWVTDHTNEFRQRKEIQNLNHELLSANNKLLAINEEMGAINEEQAASNEELRTTNEELIETQERFRLETEIKQIAINDLKANEQNIRNMVQQSPVGMCILQGDPLYVTEVNDAFLNIIGKTHEEIKLKPYWEILPEAAEFYQPITRSVLASGETYHAREHEVMLYKYGKPETVYVDFVYEPMKDAHGATYAIMFVVIDITDNVLARRKVERAEESLRMAISASDSGTYSINSKTFEFTASTRLKELFGFYPDEEMPYEACMNQIREDYRPMAQKMVEDAVNKGVRFELEYPVIGYHDHLQRWLRGSGTLEHDSNGVDSYFTGIIFDVTEQKADEQRKNDFIGMVSHELKTPITSLNAYLQMLQGKAKKAEDTFTLGALDQSVKQVKRMTTMINGFLNISRLESGKISIDLHRFDMADLVKESEAETISMYASHQIIFAPVEETIVTADRDKIGQVISNLISNAVKYSKLGGTINIACVTINGYAVVSVKDEGIGIAKEEIDKLFERYYRVENNNHISGFGIGLYLSAEIIHRHEGKIWAESQVGKGSTFYFSLPFLN